MNVPDKSKKAALNTVHCGNCGATISAKPIYISGCRCDPDAPTWIALEPDGKLLTMSHAKYTIGETE